MGCNQFKLFKKSQTYVHGFLKSKQWCHLLVKFSDCNLTVKKNVF